MTFTPEPLPVDTYMAGGTAVALYLNHRVSVDIDLFTDKEFYYILTMR